jgi:SLBB domain
MCSRLGFPSRCCPPLGGDLTHYAATAGTPGQVGSHTVDVSSALAGEESADLTLRDGDVLTVPERTGWKNVGASVTISGEVARPGVYGIQPGERLSSLLERAGGLLPTAYPQAAAFARISVYESQQKGRQELIERLERESTVVKTAVNTTGKEEAALQEVAIEQRQRILEALRRAPISGRLVIHLHLERKGFAGSADDIELRAGDSLEIPKLPGFVLIVGQVYHSNAITFTPRKKAGWYLLRSGGATHLANKGAIFILRANGSVTSGKDGTWPSGVLSSEVGPGDTIVVPEKVTAGGSGWQDSAATAQMAEATALMGAMGIR